MSQQDVIQDACKAATDDHVVRNRRIPQWNARRDFRAHDTGHLARVAVMRLLSSTLPGLPKKVSRLFRINAKTSSGKAMSFAKTSSFRPMRCSGNSTSSQSLAPALHVPLAQRPTHKTMDSGKLLDSHQMLQSASSTICSFPLAITLQEKQDSNRVYALPFFSALHFAHRAFVALLIAFFPAADMTLFFLFALRAVATEFRKLPSPLKSLIAFRTASNCCCASSTCFSNFNSSFFNAATMSMNPPSSDIFSRFRQVSGFFAHKELKGSQGQVGIGSTFGRFRSRYRRRILFHSTTASSAIVRAWYVFLLSGERNSTPGLPGRWIPKNAFFNDQTNGP